MLHSATPLRPDSDRRLAVGTAFAGCAGLFHPAAGSVGVVLVGPWGFEALATAKAWRELAEMFADAGYPVLRYDHPCSGDSLDLPEADWTTWRDSLVAAADHLRTIASVGPLILVGQGIGAALMLDTAGSIPDVHLVCALAPVSSGRRYLREQTALGAISGTGEVAVMPGGFRLPPGIAAALPDIDPKNWHRERLPPAVVACRPDRADDRRLADGLGAETLDYEGYAASATDPTTAVIPRTDFTAILERVTALRPPAPQVPTRTVAVGRPLVGDGFVETPVRFGPNGRLFGILARPEGGANETAVVIANAGRDGHVGWGRLSVDMTRAAARKGYAALRIDLSGIGESLVAPPDEGRELLYDTVHQDDLLAAVDFLGMLGHHRCVLTGRCSGAFAALHAAGRSKSVVGIMPINPLRIVWDPDETVADAITADIRPLDTLARRAFSGEVLRRVVTGKIPIRRTVARLASRVAQRYPHLSYGKAARLRTAAYELLRDLSRRGIRVAFVFSDGDGGLDRLSGIFGRSMVGMQRLTRLSLVKVENADHNLNQADARAAVTTRLLDLLEELG